MSPTDDPVTRPVHTHTDLLADWFPLRDELCDLRSQDFLSAADEDHIRHVLSSLVDIADDIVGDLVPDLDSRRRITGQAPVNHPTHAPTANPTRTRKTSPMDTLGYNEILTHVDQRFGITLTVNPCGNHYLSLQSRLETGDWLWITEYVANITPLSRRMVLEASGINLGWHIAVYPNDPSADPASPDPFTWLASVTHETARAHQLPDLVETALRALPRHEQHHIEADGNHHISAGITDWALDSTAAHHTTPPATYHHAHYASPTAQRSRTPICRIPSSIVGERGDRENTNASGQALTCGPQLHPGMRRPTGYRKP